MPCQVVQRPPVRDLHGSKGNMPTPVSHIALSRILCGYDEDLMQFIINGFRNGFRIGCYGLKSQTSMVKNLKSADEFPSVVDQKISKELQLGRIIGPYDEPPHVQNYKISPLGVVPKKTAGKFRIIHHLSYPEGSSVNDFIPREISSVQYATVQDAISIIKQTRLPVFMAKVDIESAFRIIPVSPVDRPLLGFQWKGKFYMDAVLPMGCASSCSIFESFSTSLEWVARHKLGATAVVHVIDDFLFLAHTYAKCELDLRNFINLCKEIGVPLAPDKTVAPCRVIEFLGITLDAERMEARLPQDKLAKGRALLGEFLSKEKVTLRDLQSLIGVLNFACTVIVPGRAFLRRLIDMTMGVQKPYHHIRLTRQAKYDLKVWQDFLEHFNGRSMFLNDALLTGDYLQLYTDAAGGIGFGAICGTEWFHGLWPLSWRAYNIAVLELYPIVAAVSVWGNRWENKSVCFYTDNQALVSILNMQTSRETKVMTLIRPLVLACLCYNINFSACHIPGRNNTLADKLSRSQLQEFRALAPWADANPREIPYSVSPLGLRNL